MTFEPLSTSITIATPKQHGRSAVNNYRVVAFACTVMSLSVAASRAPVPLDPVQRDVACTILQDCVDQLKILGGIIPNFDKPSALEAVSYQGIKE